MAPLRGRNGVSLVPTQPPPTAASSSASGGIGGPRTIYSCEPCRRRKVKCDGTSQCKNCRRRGEECRWIKSPITVGNEAAARGTNITTPRSLAARIDRIEEALCAAGLLNTGQIALTSPLSLSSSSPLSQTGLPNRHSPPRTVTIAISDLVESADRFDHQIIAADVEDQEEVEDLADGTDGDQVQLQTYSALVRRLPPRAQCDTLVSAYFEQLEWIHHPIHVPSFIDWYKAFWSTGIQSRQCLQRLALLFSILCLAVHFDLQVWPNITMADLSSDARYHQASQDALCASDYLANHSMSVIQTLILQGLYLNNCGQGDTHHANLALAIRMANGLGLSQLDAGRSGKSQKFGSIPSSSFLERELGRRVYWSLVCQDCYTASSCNFTYNIPPTQIKTCVFADLRDDEIAAAHTPSPQRQQLAHSVRPPTTSTYHREKITFALTARKAVDLYNEDRLTHDAIPELDRENLANYVSLPSYLRLDRPPWQCPGGSSHDLLGWGPGPSDSRSWNAARMLTSQLQWQRLFLGFTIHNRTMRLHRAYLTRGYTDAKYTESKNATLRAAVSLLELLEEAKRIAFPLQWWVVLIHVFTASVALCIDLHMRSSQRHGAGDDYNVERERSLRLVHTAIDVLEAASRKSKAAKRAVRVVQTLLTQSQRHRDDTATATAAEQTAPSVSAPSFEEGAFASSGAGTVLHDSTSWESALESWLSQTQSDTAAGSFEFLANFDEGSLDGMSPPGYLSKELLDTINSFTSSLS